MDKPVCYIVVRQRESRFHVEVLSSTYDIAAQGGSLEDALASAFERVMLEVEHDLDSEEATMPVTTSEEDKMDLRIARIARVAHEAERAYCESLGDSSRLPWEKTSETDRRRVMGDVRRFLLDPNVTPEELFAARTLSTETEFTKLSPAEQRKSYLFLSIVKSMA